jgi:hypothetical protein
MSTNLVTLATFDTSIKAEMAKAALAEAGIQSELGDENLVTMNWLLSNAVGGIKLVVREEDAERALAAYREIELDFAAGTDVDEDELTRQALAAEPEDGPLEPDEESA